MIYTCIFIKKKNRIRRQYVRDISFPDGMAGIHVNLKFKYHFRPTNIYISQRHRLIISTLSETDNNEMATLSSLHRTRDVQKTESSSKYFVKFYPCNSILRVPGMKNKIRYRVIC